MHQKQKGVYMLLVVTFGKSGCAPCESTKRKVDHLIKKHDLSNCVEYKFYDITASAEGLALGAFFEALIDIPNTFIWKDMTLDEANDSNYIASWHNKVPGTDLKDILLTEKEECTNANDDTRKTERIAG